ncbi:hypothetical protein C0J52_12228, partial [Blattella germanica]
LASQFPRSLSKRLLSLVIPQEESTTEGNDSQINYWYFYSNDTTLISRSAKKSDRMSSQKWTSFEKHNFQKKKKK